MTTSDKPLTPNQLMQLLDKQGIFYELEHHAPLHTVEDTLAHRDANLPDDGEIKNLFLRNKKGQMWLFTVFHKRRLDLKKTAEFIDAKRFSFCSEDRLMQYLGVKPGAVSPFCLLNDTDKVVTFYLDALLLTHTYWYPHPLDNTMTLKISRDDMLRVIENNGHHVNIIDFTKL